MYKWLLISRYLRTRYIALASIVSVMLGVATMIVVNSVMAGFATEMRERIHGILADIVVETHTLDGDPDAAARMQEIQEVAGNYVEAMTATVEVYGMISFKYRGQVITRPVTLIGIDPGTKTLGIAACDATRRHLWESCIAMRGGDRTLPNGLLADVVAETRMEIPHDR